MRCGNLATGSVNRAFASLHGLDERDHAELAFSRRQLRDVREPCSTLHRGDTGRTRAVAHELHGRVLRRREAD